MDKMMIRNLRLRCTIGIDPDELKEKQDVVVNVSIWSDFSKAVVSDRLQDTVNYWHINKKIIHLVEESKFNLVETLADRIAALCLEEPGVERVKVRVEKPKALKSAESVGAEIVRSRRKA
ncbi:MAG TPA: dihydroneopterin aldolase [Candidatus Saccharimonadales bacterium]|nr:dihydroneopterin aldolase [Candidatus Saccharimonadales bacterium]